LHITPKNWPDFQHYKGRRPPWIRLYRTLLDDFDFQSLDDASRALAPMLWLLASEFDGGIIDTTLEKLSFRFRRPETEIRLALIPLVNKGFFMCDSILLANGSHHASNVPAPRKQDAKPEESRVEADTGREGSYGLVVVHPSEVNNTTKDV
jgi:hypothetical protein